MVLDNKTQKKINEFVYSKPRTIQEISLLIQKNWRTANNYVEKISQETGLISTRIFRGGTRGALKIVYWNNIEKVHSSQVQERLFKQIESGRIKQDFSPLEIYQYVDEKKRDAFIEYRTDCTKAVNQNIIDFLCKTEKQLLHFSGNISWIIMTEKGKKLIDVAEELARRNVSIKVLSRVEVPGIENVKKLLAINQRVGRDIIEIRHCHQPLRGFIIDDKEARFREEKDPAIYQKGELKGELGLFYEIFDNEWVEWLQKVFWNLFRTSIPAEKRIKDLESFQKL